MGGRGSGKTRAGAEWIANGVRAGTMQRIAIIGATHHEARSIMIEGVAGLLSVSEGAHYEPSLRRVTWPDGQVATVLSADEPDSIRGHQFDSAWADELCKWSEPQETLDMIAMALRLGENPQMTITTTPRKIPALTARAGAPLLAAAQAQKHVTHNEALYQFDALLCARFLDRDLSAPPSSPADGDTYLVKATGTGAWAGQDGKIAYCADGGWRFYAPFAGLVAYVSDEAAIIVYDDGSWLDYSATLAPA
ncbi:MAG TPA: DUF2793 domain-containing protein, partial [Rhizomicrobium sp.]